VIHKNGKVLLNQKPPKGFLGGLWEFPNWNLERRKDLKKWLRNQIKREAGLSIKVKEPIGVFHQTYSHFKLTLSVYHCQALNRNEKGRWVPMQKLYVLPMSRIHRRIAKIIRLHGMSCEER